MTAETHTSNVSAFHDHRGPSQVIDDSKKSKQFIMPRRYQQLGALFDTWLKHYQQIERQWLNIENSSDCIVENGHDSVDVLLRKMNILRNKINKERPAWRFSLQNVFSWQVGWPFYRNRSHLAALLLDELNHLEKKIEMMIQALKPTAISTACGVVQSTPQSALPVITRLPVDCASSDKNQANLNHDLQQSSSLQDISESNIRSIDEWLGIINSAFSNWQDHEATFKPFESDAQFKKFIDMFLKYRDSLSGEVLHLTIQTWLALIDLLSLEVNDTDELPHESRQQMLLIISLQSLMESDPATELRQTLIENCMSQSRQLFGSRQVVYDLRGSYPSNGLYGQSSGINQYITHTPMYKL
ncbi:MAG: hypothetical protein ACD_45C00141G0001 [uncultured bacterium]|nr:MAG: hypothetical protein ACD_45C00141G0001 [uncultured bacterium]